jgi:hypothetical protein
MHTHSKNGTTMQCFGIHEHVISPDLNKQKIKEMLPNNARR